MHTLECNFPRIHLNERRVGLDRWAIQSYTCQRYVELLQHQQQRVDHQVDRCHHLDTVLERAIIELFVHRIE